METSPLKYWSLTTHNQIYIKKTQSFETGEGIIRKKCVSHAKWNMFNDLPKRVPSNVQKFCTDPVRSQMKLEVSVKNSALILADIIIYCPGYRLASAPNMNQANSQLGKQTKKDMSAGGSAETQRIKPILAAVRQAEQIRDKPHSISQKRYLVLRFKSYGVLTNKIEFF